MLCHDGEEIVRLEAEDYQTFFASQRECVEAVRDRRNGLAAAEAVRSQIANLFMDIVSWGKKNGVAAIIWGPRPEEGFFAVIASDEDEDGRVQESLSRLDYQLYHKYKFKLSFVLFRKSEAEGVDSFIAPKAGRPLFRAGLPGPSRQGKSEYPGV